MSLRFFTLILLSAVLNPFIFGAQTTNRHPLITSAVTNADRTALGGHIHPLAQSRYDQGVAPASLPMERMLLFLKRTPDQEAALGKFLEDVQNPASPNFHQFVTPEEFGQRFGANESDVQTVVNWLTAEGFKIGHVSKGRNVIEFSGTAGLLQTAFQTAIHKFVVNGEEHWANANNPTIPAALSPAVLGFASLHNFAPKPNSHVRASGLEAIKQADSPTPLFTSSGGSHYLAPNDFNTIYSVNKVSSYNGTGATIAIIGRTNINIQDVVSFRSVFGLPLNTPTIIVNGADPGNLGGGELVEALLDTQWSGVAASAAKVDLVVSASTSSTDGTLLSEEYIINNNLADIMSESFGACEAADTASGAQFLSALAAQAAAQGITYLVSSGDSGSAGCDASNSASATGPVSVNVLGSNPYTITVGGTQFNENGSSQYWTAANATGFASATGYIPEEVWNANCTGTVCGTGSIASTGGGASMFFAKPSWQTGVSGIPNDGKRDVPDVSLSAAGHDAYLLCINASCTPIGGKVSFGAVYGTSASTPALAGILALVKQRVGARLGNIAPTLYRMAATQNVSSCNASSATVPVASTCIFNDVTIGTNSVPGEANYNTASATYNANVGFDLATGLGSVNAANLVSSWGAAGAPNAGLSPTAITFPSQTLGTTSSPSTITLNNSGAAALSVVSITITGSNPSDFTSTNNCGSSLAAGSSCTISVTFTPTASGARSANLVVTDNSGNVAASTQSVALSGTGTSSSGGGGSTAKYLGGDTSTQGSWSGKYGADGQIIANSTNNPPSYASVTFTGASTWTWAASTTDLRGLQTSSGSISRIASTYYSSNGFTIDVNLTDGNTHRLALYLCDYDYGSRIQKISILDAASGTLLDSETYSSFASGVWGVWSVKGHVTVQVTYVAGNNAVLGGIFVDTPGGSTGATATATYTGSDTSTQGTFNGKYGADGQLIANDLSNPPSYASIAFSGASTYTWQGSTSDVRALQTSTGSSARIASTYYSAGTFNIDVNLTDGNTHAVALYMCDWDYSNRIQKVSILDASTNAVLSSQTYSAFGSGVWGVWNIKGHVILQVTNTGGNNAIVCGLFFGGAGTTSTGGATASYVGSDTATKGTWTSAYGADGQLIANDFNNPPSYAGVSLSGSSTYTWVASTGDARALQISSGSSTRISSTYYSSNGFNININLNDGNTHRLALYMCDWDFGSRVQKVSIIDAASNTLLNTQTYSSFTGGVWGVWNIKGNVIIQIIYVSGNNAVVQGLFFN